LDNQYSFLKISINILKILSYIFAALGLLGALIILFGKSQGSDKIASLGVLLLGGLYFLIAYLIAEIIRLLINVENRLKQVEQSIQAPKREIR
jgi:hypothetical protein